jgi:hypothetical protein
MTSNCVKIMEDSYYFEIKPFNAEIISFEMKMLFDFKFQLKPNPWYGFTCKRVTFIQICKCVYNFYYAGTSKYIYNSKSLMTCHEIMSVLTQSDNPFVSPWQLFCF